MILIKLIKDWELFNTDHKFIFEKNVDGQRTKTFF